MGEKRPLELCAAHYITLANKCTELSGGAKALPSVVAQRCDRWSSGLESDLLTSHRYPSADNLDNDPDWANAIVKLFWMVASLCHVMDKDIASPKRLYQHWENLFVRSLTEHDLTPSGSSTQEVLGPAKDEEFYLRKLAR